MPRNSIKNIALLVVCSVISACASSNSTAVASATEASTSIAAPTQTAFPTRTPAATITPYPTLSDNRPYFVIQHDDSTVLEYDANGFGRKIVELPPDGQIPIMNPTLKRIISPDGKWMAFYTGKFENSSSPANLPITLNLLNIDDGTVIKVSDVVLDGYKEKLEQVAENLKKLYPERHQPIDNRDWVSQSVRFAFEWSIFSLSWAPNSQALAFAAQIDGMSSDVYLYNLETSSTRRIENSLQSVSGISWSPDGKFIVFNNSEPGYVYTGSSLYAIKPSDQIIEDPERLYSGTWLSVGDWLSPNHLLVADGTDTAGNFNLQALDIETGNLRMLWPAAVGAYAIDPSNQIIAVNTGEFTDLEKMGLYYVTYSGRHTKVWDGLYWASLFFRGGKTHRFLIQGSSETSIKSTYPLSGNVVGLGYGSGPSFIGQFDYDKISISPNNHWLLMFDNTMLYLFNADDELVQTFPIPEIRSIVWRPDSQAILYSSGKEVYILSIPNGNPRLVDECEQIACYLHDVVWLP